MKAVHNMTANVGIVGKNEKMQKWRYTESHILFRRLEMHGGGRGANTKLPFNA
jgi:hypothetical protein